MKQLQLGFHVSIAGSLDLAVDRAMEAQCTSFQMFTRNPRGWKFKSLADDQVTKFLAKRKKAQFESIVVHMPYLPNLASSSRVTRRRSRASLTAEVDRCGRLGVDFLVAHIGSHQGKGCAEGVRNVIDACNEALEASQNSTAIAIENMAGQKNCVGSTFEELAMILDGVRQSDRIGVCLDTCHLYAAGFDISTRTGVGATLDRLERLVGLERLLVVHLNDSKSPLGSRMDRHEHIGMGKIGEKGFEALLRTEAIRRHPILMETPRDERRSDADEMVYVRSIAS